MLFDPKTIRVAVVHEWLTSFAGSEKVLQLILELFPQADLFVMVDFLDKEKRQQLKCHSINTSFIQKLPFAKKAYRNYLPLMPYAVEQFDLSPYDLIISSNHAVAKGVLTKASQLHICYCHSPMRYAWDLYHDYLRESGLTKGLKSWLVRHILHRLRIWDYRTANGVDVFVANSRYVARRIRKIYGRQSKVIHPGVDVDGFLLSEGNRKDHFLAASRFVPYKRLDLIIKAFNDMPHLKLHVIGDGPDRKKLKNIAKDNVIFLGAVSDEALQAEMRSCKAFLFAAEEDFGIMPVEAQACGTPVIAFGKGGVLDSVVPHKTGMLFEEQTVESVINAVKKFSECTWDEHLIRKHAEQFDNKCFKKMFSKLVEKNMFELVSGKTL